MSFNIMLVLIVSISADIYNKPLSHVAHLLLKKNESGGLFWGKNVAYEKVNRAETGRERGMGRAGMCAARDEKCRSVVGRERRKEN